MSQKDKVWGEGFINLAKSKGFFVKKPTKSQYDNFVNFLLVGKSADGSPKTVRVSLKLNKKNKPKSSWVWVELKTHSGTPGWLYGESDFIVFELADKYLFASRKSLLHHIHETVDFNAPFVQEVWAAKYQIYQRPNKLDQITQIKVANLQNLEGVYLWDK